MPVELGFILERLVAMAEKNETASVPRGSRLLVLHRLGRQAGRPRVKPPRTAFRARGYQVTQ
jgi:hypothetical protein